MKVNIRDVETYAIPSAASKARSRVRGWGRVSPALRWFVVVALLLMIPTVGVLALALFQDAMIPTVAASTSAEAPGGECADWPTVAWCTSTPEEQGMDSTQLEQMMRFVDEHDMEIDSVVVVRHGAIVFERYRNSETLQKAHHLQSVTKSFSSMLIGIAIQQGLIEDVDQRVVDFFPQHTIANMDARKQSLTLEHLLTMSEGMDWHELDYPYSHSSNTLGQMWASRDAIQYVLDRPMARDPGRAWAYNSGTSILLGGIIEQVTGGDVQSFARQNLFDPIGIGEVSWAMTTGGHYHTDGGLYMTSRDMARFGYLMLHNGIWDGQEIVPADWVSRSSTAHYQTDGGSGYGYQWWILPGGLGYAARGHYEQLIYVLPEADMVAVFTADIPDDDPYRVDGLLYRFIVPACTDLSLEDTTQTYAQYGFAFEYPGSFSLQETPIPGRDTVSDASGLVQVTAHWYPPEIVSVLWDTPEAGADVKMYLNRFLASLARESGLEISLDASLDSWQDGHHMAVQFFDVEVEGLQLAAVAGAWYCAESHRIFVVTYVTGPEVAAQELSDTFQEHLDSFHCHELP